MASSRLLQEAGTVYGVSTLRYIIRRMLEFPVADKYARAGALPPEAAEALQQK